MSSSIYRHSDIYEIAYAGFDGDCEYYINHTKKGKILYLGVGTGRVFAEMYKQNNAVFGIDISPAMLDMLFSKHSFIPKSQCILADAMEAKFDFNSFDKIVAPYAFLNYFTSLEIKKILQNVNNWLKPGGEFITDMLSPFRNPHFEQEHETYLNYTDPQGRKIKIDIEYDHINQMFLENASVQFPDGHTELVTLENFYYYPNEMRLLFEQANLTVKSIFGSFHNEEITIASNVLVIHSFKLLQR